MKSISAAIVRHCRRDGDAYRHANFVSAEKKKKTFRWRPLYVFSMAEEARATLVASSLSQGRVTSTM